MNEDNQNNSWISKKKSKTLSERNITTATTSRLADDGRTPPRSTYELFYWLNYTRMFTTRLARDLFKSLLEYCYNDSAVLLPDYIVDLMNVQKSLRTDRESHAITYSSSRKRHRVSSLRIIMKKYFNAFKSHILSSEDDSGIQYAPTKYHDSIGVEREPMFVIVDSSCASNPSSKELLIENRHYKNEAKTKKYFNKNSKPVDVPSTSRVTVQSAHDIDVSSPPQIKESESREELQMIDINLQSENDILVGDAENDKESIVISYLKNKDAFLDMEGTVLSSKKKSSLLESVPKMETILEGEPFNSFPIYSKSELPSQELVAISPLNEHETDEETIERNAVNE